MTIVFTHVSPLDGNCFPILSPALWLCSSLSIFLTAQKVGATSSKDWVFDKAELESAFNEKTRIIVVNTPHNPVGKASWSGFKISLNQAAFMLGF